MFEYSKKAIVGWLSRESGGEGFRLHDFDAICRHLKVADVLLVEGRTHVSGIVQAVTLSNWSHSALYVGRLRELPDAALQARLRSENGWDGETQLLLEAELGLGTVLSNVNKYRRYHVRICRPHDLLAEDARRMVRFGLGQLGRQYDVRQILDLLRFFFPYGLMPRHWRSTLFDFRSGVHTRTVCSTLVAQLFAHVRFPILPIIQRDESGRLMFARRNSRLFVPRDFDNSPYFEIIKYPFLGGCDVELYRQMHWDTHVVLDNAANQAVLGGGCGAGADDKKREG